MLDQNFCARRDEPTDALAALGRGVIGRCAHLGATLVVVMKKRSRVDVDAKQESLLDLASEVLSNPASCDRMEMHSRALQVILELKAKEIGYLERVCGSENKLSASLAATEEMRVRVEEQLALQRQLNAFAVPASVGEASELCTELLALRGEEDLIGSLKEKKMLLAQQVSELQSVVQMWAPNIPLFT
jgi:hypothetical protein